MALQDNIKYFDNICGFIFEKLYLSFPLEMEIKEEDTLPEKDKLAYDIEQPELIFSETMHWLNKEGFISFNNGKIKDINEKIIPNSFFSNTVLTNKSLIALKNNDNADKLIEAIKNKQSGEIRRIANLILVNKS